VTLYFLLPALLVGGAAWAVVTYVGTNWIADIFSTPTQPITDTQQPDIGFVPGPEAPVEVGLPPIEGSPIELRTRGIELYGAGNYADAIRYLEGAANMGSDDALSYYHLGLAYLAVTGRPHSIDDAELAFRTAASLQPNWAATHRMLAESLIRGGYYEEAIGPALEATVLEPTMSEAWLTLSSAYKGAGRDSEATQAYAEATKHSPAPPMAP
jgi:Flp pilus assembly protein TadD